MRICLYWNKSAGGGISLDRVTALIDGAGHHVAMVVEDASDLPSHLDDIDCVVAAGGDGTVARAGRTLAGGPLPLAILPLGTANNIARSLAIHGDVAPLAERWPAGNVAKSDVGVVDYGPAPSRFIESVGCGLGPRCIEVGATISKDDRDSHLEDARALYLDTLGHLKPRPYQIVLDGEEVAGDFLLVEALNTPSIGPKLEFAEHVSVADGFLSVVVAAESDRAMLREYIASLENGSEPRARFKSWRARAITIAGAKRIHVDDRVIEGCAPITIAMQPSSLSILA